MTETHYSLAEWIVAELEALARKRAAAKSAEERAQLELQIISICDLAQRYGSSLSESAEPL